MILLQEWLPREGHWLFAWWLSITLAGLAAFPMCVRLLGGLPDRGYTLARAIGMLLVTFIYWLFTSYGLLDNSVGSIVIAWILVLLMSMLVYRRRGSWRDIGVWWQENRGLVLVAELLFLALFLIWAIYRAHQNDIVGTEKPMELAFMSAVQRSPSFPPADPWLSGYAISYYYMGYVMSSMLSMVSGISSTVGFNLTIASQFALTGLCAFGVAYNLARSRGTSRRAASRDVNATPVRAIVTGMVAMLFMTLVGNFQAVLIEIPYESRSVPQSYLESWATQQRANFGEGAYEQDPQAKLSADLENWDYWWWFRASRVVTDYNLDGTPVSIQPIDEFPAFSFLLADNHPHVLALPCALLAIGLMANVILTRRQPDRYELLLYGITVGGLIFLNTWDGPIYMIGLIAAEGLRRLLLNDRGRLTAGDYMSLLAFGMALAGIVLIAYMPFLVSFRSQAGGLLPNLIHPTALGQFFIMFGPIIAILSVYLLVEARRGRQLQRMNWRFGVGAGVLLLAVLSLLMLLPSVLGALGSTWAQTLSHLMDTFGGWEALVPLILQRRIENIWVTLLLLIGIILVLARIFPTPHRYRNSEESDQRNITFSPATACALLLIGLGLCLTLLPEFVFLRDNFASRINTVFKFYYQAWSVWSIAAAYALYSIVFAGETPRLHPLLRFGFLALAVISIVAGLVYSLLGVKARAWIETGRSGAHRNYSPPQDWDNPILHVAEGAVVSPGAILYTNGDLNDATEFTMIRSQHDGIVSVENYSITILERLSLDGQKGLVHDDDYSVITCLDNLVQRDQAIVAEAVRDAYNVNYGRVGTLTGIPVVLGWENHQRQWRGPTYVETVGSRSQDMQTLFTTDDMSRVHDIIERYNIDYILFGTTERAQYGSAGEEKFLDHLAVICESNDSRIFAVGSSPG